MLRGIYYPLTITYSLDSKSFSTKWSTNDGRCYIIVARLRRLPAETEKPTFEF